MTPQELEQYLHRNIPLSRAMEVRVPAADERRVVLAAPLEPNINHRDTLFGGSAAAVATLAAWSLLYLRLLRDGIDARLVIHRNTMEYKRPIAGEFTATARLDDEAAWEQFVTTLRRRGKARIRVASVLHAVQNGLYGAAAAGGEAGLFEGDFVALANAPQEAGAGFSASAR
ncbi:MAG: YiiD C-terminal domain-containing protein [Limnochordales bacterium]|nr:MAG: thioesterase [Bacillota bacterium]